MRSSVTFSIYITTLVFLTMCVEIDAQMTEDMNTQNSKKELTSINVVVGNETFNATLFDNPTSLSLMEQMPFSVEIEDYAGNEKIFYPPEILSKDGAPNGAAPTIGDIMYYAPWGDVAIFYKEFRFATGLIPSWTYRKCRGICWSNWQKEHSKIY